MTALLDAIINGDLNQVIEQLNKGASANQIGKDGLHALHYAAMANQPEIFKILVTHGANIHAVDFHNNSTLYFAARHMGDANFIQYIIDAGVSVNGQNKIGQTALHMAARLGNTPALQTLLINGANATLKNVQGKTALHDAVNTSHVKEALILIEYGANVNAQDNYSKSPKDFALTSHNDAMALLFSLPIISQIKLSSTHSNLIDYVIAGDIESVKEKLAAGVYSDLGNNQNFTALHYAVINGENEITKILAENDFSLIQTNNQGQQAIHFAAMIHNAEMIDLLKGLGAAINAVDKLGNTPLHYAVENAGSGTLVQHLLDLGAGINTKNNLGETALHVAAREDNAEVVKVLLANHADEKIEDKLGETALEEAINVKADEVVALLKHSPMKQEINLDCFDNDMTEEVINTYRQPLPLQTSDVLDTEQTLLNEWVVPEQALHEECTASPVLVEVAIPEMVPTEHIV